MYINTKALMLKCAPAQKHAHRCSPRETGSCADMLALEFKTKRLLLLIGSLKENLNALYHLKQSLIFSFEVVCLHVKKAEQSLVRTLYKLDIVLHKGARSEGRHACHQLRVLSALFNVDFLCRTKNWAQGSYNVTCIKACAFSMV